jgi:hypothetical protein
MQGMDLNIHEFLIINVRVSRIIPDGYGGWRRAVF